MTNPFNSAPFDFSKDQICTCLPGPDINISRWSRKMDQLNSTLSSYRKKICDLEQEIAVQKRTKARVLRELRYRINTLEMRLTHFKLSKREEEDFTLSLDNLKNIKELLETL